MECLTKISAIIVALNEEVLIEQIIGELKKQKYDGGFEIILADGGSSDNTVNLAKAHNVQVVCSEKKGKSFQMNAAAKRAKGQILFFVHADMQFPDSVFTAIAEALKSGHSGGGFANEYDYKNEKIKRLGNLMNFRIFDKREQSDKGIFYGDNGIFVLKEAFEEINGFKEISIMEDYDFSTRMCRKYRTIKIYNPKILVSSRRHVKVGFLKTRLQWIIIRTLYKWGVSPNYLGKLYKDIR